MIYDYYRNIKGCRFRIAMMLKNKIYDTFMIALIILYTLFVLVQFGIDQQDWFTKVETKIYICELVVLGIFVIEILFHLYAFARLYIKDYWNIADIVVILISIVFVILDLTVSSNSPVLKGILKIRGIFRLLRVFILIRKLNIVRIKREIRSKTMTSSGYDLRSPLEKVLEILTEVRDSIDPGDSKMI
jgi:hypothetical protein